MKKMFLVLVSMILVTNAFAGENKNEDATTTPRSKVILSEPESQFTEATDIATLTDAFTMKFKNEASLKFYGRIEMLTYYDTTSPFLSDWLVFVYPKNAYDGREDSFSMSARGSPFGFLFNMPDSIKSADISAKLEMDFVGGFTTGSSGTYSPLVRLKQAYVSIDTEHFGFLAGQSFAIFSPLFPAQASWIALGTSGNPWIRLPQLRATIKYNPIKFEASINRPMGANEAFGNQLDDIISDGEQSNMPLIIGRFGYSEDFNSWKLETGASGVFGKEKIHREETDPTTGVITTLDKKLNIWMFGYDLKIITKYIDFLGEFFIGDNLNTFFAGVLQGVYIDVPTQKAHSIRAMGGWGQLTFKPTKKLFLNLGAGIDKPRHSDLVTLTSRTSNFTAFGNVNYNFNKWLGVGLEGSYMRTGYLNKETNSNWRGLLRTSFTF